MNSMNALSLSRTKTAEEQPLVSVQVPPPVPASQEILVRVQACGVCRTDLHIVEGDLALPRLPLIPGHQIVGVVVDTGPGVTRFRNGDRVGIPWLYSTCGECEFCSTDRENLCNHARFTGFHVDGGYAEATVVHQDFAYQLPSALQDTEVAPLLCAGVIGYRALRLSNVKQGQRIALYGFGASAHIALQITRFWNCEAYVFTRGPHHRELAVALGAAWTGGLDDRPPHPVDASVIFAPAGEIVRAALRNLKKGGTVSLAGIHMTPIPEIPYNILYEERTLRSVANSTRNDVKELLDLAGEIPIHTKVELFRLDQANEVLLKLKRSELRGSGVLRIESFGPFAH